MPSSLFKATFQTDTTKAEESVVFFTKEHILGIVLRFKYQPQQIQSFIQ
jgi:hypothetical protein